MKTRHAVLFYPDHFMPNTSIMWIDGNNFHKEELPDPCYTLYDLCKVAYPRFITHLWVMPSYGEFEPVGNNKEWGISPYYNRSKKMMGASIFFHGHQRKDLEIIFPQYTSWWVEDGWIKEVDPQELLITFHYLEQKLGVSIGASPGRVGWRFLKQLHPEWIEEVNADLRGMHFSEAAAENIVFPRRKTDAIMVPEGRYLHKFDRSSAFPYAAAVTFVGKGIPVHIDQDNGSAEHYKGHPQEVGVWRCTIAFSAENINPLLPPVWDGGEHKPEGYTEGWLSGPIIRLLRSQGHAVYVQEGYVFPERHGLFASSGSKRDGWADRLWDLRTVYGSPGWKNQRCAKFAQRAIKQIANSTVGMTAFGGFEEEDEMKRPDIRTQVIARHRELTYHNIVKVYELYKLAPIMVYSDALYYVSDNSDGRAVVPELVKREGQLGGYKYCGYVEIDEEVREMFGTPLHTGMRLNFLNKRGWK